MKFNLIHGSETGTSQGLIGQLCNELLQLNNGPNEPIQVELFYGDQYIQNLTNKQETNLIIICSSTGDGDPPESCIQLKNRLKELVQSGDKTILNHIQFALLGLGDSSYDHFGYFPKFVYEHLIKLGAQPKFQFQIADDEKGSESVIESWLNDIVPLIQSWNSGSIPATVYTQLNNVSNAEVSGNVESAENSITVNLQDTVISDPNEPLNHPLPRNYDQPIKLDLTELQSLTAISGFPKNPPELANFILEQQPDSYKPVSDQDIQLKSHANSFIGHLASVSSLTSSNAVKRTLLVNIELPEDTEPFVPGDAFGICCPNDNELVDRLLTRVLVTPDQKDQIVKIDAKPNSVLPAHLTNFTPNITLKQLFTNFIDLNSFPKKAWFRMLAEYTNDNNQKQILLAMVSKQGGNLYNQLKSLNPSILDILVYFNSAQPPIERLLDTLPPLQPRYYSAASSPLVSPTQMRLAFNVVQYNLDNDSQHLRHGLCTPWLDQISGHVASNSSHDLTNPHPICLFRKQTAQNFHLPTQTNKPVLMIGPGTGVAPFIGFLQHRHYQRQLKKKMGGFQASITQEISKLFGKMWLIFGTRDPKKDYLFEKELASYVDNGTLTRLDCCFSRTSPTQEIKYVQHVLLNNKEQVYDFIMNQNGHIYICGDAKNMAKEVHQAFIDILQGPPELNRTKLEATQLLTQLMQEGRYLRDLWA